MDLLLRMAISMIPEVISKEIWDYYSTKITAVSCGNGHTSFLTTTGEVYICSNNFFGHLGLDCIKLIILPILYMSHVITILPDLLN